MHHGTLHNKQDVAIKIQYPGVALGIQSDIENLVGIMKVQSDDILRNTMFYIVLSIIFHTGMEYISGGNVHRQRGGSCETRTCVGSRLYKRSRMYEKI